MAVKTKIKEFNSFQKAAIQWLVPKKRSLVVAPPGAGKSLAMTGFFALLRKKGFATRMVIFTKTKAMVAFNKANFQNLSITKVCSARDLLQFYPDNPFSSDIYLISTSLLPQIGRQTPLIRKGFSQFMAGCNLLCVDELHDMRNYKSRVSSSLKKITDWYSRLVDAGDGTHRICGITATPIIKNLENWYSAMSYIEPRLFGSYYQFLDTYCIVNQKQAYVGQKLYTSNGSHHVKKSLTFTEIVGYRNVENLYQRLEPYVFQYTKTDFTFHFNVEYYTLTPMEKDIYANAIKGLGLDKYYNITLQNNNRKSITVYRDKTDEFILPGLMRKTVLCQNIVPGTRILYDGQVCTVTNKVDKTKDGTHSVRLIKAQQTVSASETKLNSILKQVQSLAHGCMIYCNYHSSVDAIQKYLVTHGVKRRIVTLTGKTANLNAIVEGLSPEDVVIVTKVCLQSLDFYFDTLIIAEVLSSPGLLEQLAGRLARSNSPFRDINVYFLLRPQSIEEYFYARARFLLQTAKTNQYMKNLPKSVTMQEIEDSTVSLQLLKDTLLWKS